MPARALLALIAGSLVLAISVGLRQSFGLFVGPISLDLTLSTGAVGLAVAIQQLLWGATQPFAGMLADKFGTRLVLIPGALAYAAGLAVIAGANGAGSLQLGFGLLIGTGLSGAGFSIVFAAIARAVPAPWRSAAAGIASAGGSIGQFIFAPVGQWLIAHQGWPTSLMIYALIALLMAPLAFALAPAGAAAGPAGGGISLREAIGEACGDRSYWLLNAGFFVCGFHVAFVSTYLPGVAALCGLPPAAGATGLAIIGAANIVGSTLAGVLGGRYPMKWLLAIIYFTRAAAIGVFLVVPRTQTVFLVFALVLGFTWLGTVPLTSGVVATIFGSRYLASLFGIVFFSHQLGAFFGAWLGGRFFDATGSYDIVWQVAGVLAVVAGLLHLPIREHQLVPA